MAKGSEFKIDIGINEKSRAKIAEGLTNVLADSYTLYLKTHNFHWNVTGPRFQPLHTIFEEQYTELALAVDQIAERIRALGFVAPGSYAEFAKATKIKEAGKVPPKAEEMVKILAEDHERVAKTIRPVLADAGKVNDDVSADVLTQRISVHEKTAWMLRSMI